MSVVYSRSLILHRQAGETPRNNWEYFYRGITAACYQAAVVRISSVGRIVLFCDWLTPSQLASSVRLGRVRGTEHQRHINIYLFKKRCPEWEK